MKTVLSIEGENFLINGKLTYSEIPGCDSRMHGLLMNARLIQGIFDDKADPARFNRFGLTFSPEENTDALIAALPDWYQYGLRCFTVGLQGGGPCFTVDNNAIENNPFSPDGLQIDPAYLARLTRLLNAADELGMVVIVSALYCGQIRHLNGAQAVINAIRTTARWLREGGSSSLPTSMISTDTTVTRSCRPIRAWWRCWIWPAMKADCLSAAAAAAVHWTLRWPGPAM